LRRRTQRDTTMNAAQTAILTAMKAGKSFVVSNKNDVAAGKVHHATAKVLVGNGARLDGKSLSLPSDSKAESEPVKVETKAESKGRGKGGKGKGKGETLAFNGAGKVCGACGESLEADEVGCGCCGHKRPMGWKRAA
jgi:hypothetical protein